MLSSSGYWVFSQPKNLLGDQSRISLLATMFRDFRWMERRQRSGLKADCQASRPLDWLDIPDGHPCRATSRLTVDTARSKHLAIPRIDEPAASPRKISSRSRSVAHAVVLPEQSHHDATLHHEWSYGPCQKRGRSHAASAPPSNDATRRSSAPLKAQTVSLVS